MLEYSERMSIRDRMVILPLSIAFHYCITKTSDLTFIGCHNVQIQPCLMVVTMSVCTLSWHEDVRVCVLNCFVPYLLHKFILTLSFSYLWLWNISVLTLYHFLPADYVYVRLVNLFLFYLCIQAMETFLLPPLCVHVVSWPVSFYLYSGFYYFSSCLHVGLDLFLVWPKLNHISNKEDVLVPVDKKSSIEWLQFMRGRYVWVRYTL